MLGSVGRTKAASSSGAELTPPQCEGGKRLISTDCSASTIAGGFDVDAQFAAPRGVDAGEKRWIELEVEAADVVDGLVGDTLDAPDAGRQERRFAVRWTEISVRSRPSAFSIARSRMIGTAF